MLGYLLAPLLNTLEHVALNRSQRSCKRVIHGKLWLACAIQSLFPIKRNTL